jgi:menaquinone-dependent protoporphyrinogen oxidase
MGKVLVGYWTKTGTTEAYAGVLGQALSSRGHAVDVRPLAQVGSLGGYDAVVLGGPINGMRPVPELTGFIAANAAAMASKPTAFFTVSYMYGKAGKGWNAAILKGTRSAAAAMGAKATIILPGRIPGKLPGIMRVMFGVPKDLPLDRFDSGAMESWAGEVAAILS